MSYTAIKSFTHAASILLLGVILVGCQGGGDSGSSASNSNKSGVTDGGDDQDDNQQSASVASDSALLTWDNPEQRVNGDPFHFSEIENYVVSWGQNPDNLSNTAKVGCSNCVDMTYRVENLDAGTWYFTVQTRDTEGNLSRQADLASKQI